MHVESLLQYPLSYSWSVQEKKFNDNNLPAWNIVMKSHLMWPYDKVKIHTNYSLSVTIPNITFYAHLSEVPWIESSIEH